MKERNCSIDIFRLFCAFGVVSCHTDMLYDINDLLNIAVTHIFARYTVPIFFTVAGYYYISSLLQGKNVFGKQLKALLRVYITWSAIYIGVSLFQNLIFGELDLLSFLKEKLFYFFSYGSQYHLWYMVTLIYTLIIVTVMYKAAGEKGIQIISCVGFVMSMICALGCAYYPLGCQIPLLSKLYDSKAYSFIAEWLGMGLPYFTLGYFVYKKENSPKKWSDKTVWILWTITLVLYLIEVLVITFGVKYYERLEVLIMVYFLTGMNMMVLLRNPLPKLGKLAGFCKPLSSFVYFAHVLVLNVVEVVCALLSIEIHSILRYVLVMAIALICGHILARKGWKIKSYLM